MAHLVAMWSNLRRGLVSGIALSACMTMTACRSGGPPVIALISRTTATPLWEPLESGAEPEARRLGYKLYWNGPSREDDFEGQVALVGQEVKRHVRGIILAPSQRLALITPVRHALAEKIPVVVVSSSLECPPGDGLSYILSDDELAAELCAQRVMRLTGGHGTALLLGVAPDLAGNTTNLEGLERVLHARAPGLWLVKRYGGLNALHEQQVASLALKDDATIQVVIGLTPDATLGALAALHAGAGKRSLRVVGFDTEDALTTDDPSLDALIVQDTHAMGRLAVLELVNAIEGRSVPATVKVAPVLMTRERQEGGAEGKTPQGSGVAPSWEPL